MPRATCAGRGIDVRLGTRLASVDAEGATLSDGTRVDTATLVWAAGVAANPLVKALGLPIDGSGRVVVDEHLRVEGMPRAWSLGDCAAVPNAATPGVLDPPTCQHALRQAKRLAGNLQGRAKPYGYRTLGQVASLGHRRGIAQIPGMRLRGYLGWLVTLGYHLMQLPSVTRRSRVITDWVTAALFRRDIAELSVLNSMGATEVHTSCLRARPVHPGRVWRSYLRRRAAGEPQLRLVRRRLNVRVRHSTSRGLETRA